MKEFLKKLNLKKVGGIVAVAGVLLAIFGGKRKEEVAEIPAATTEPTAEPVEATVMEAEPTDNAQ